MGDTVVRDPRARVVVTLTRAATAVAEAVVALVDYATSRTAPAAEDPLWGRVDGEHLPPWISREQPGAGLRDQTLTELRGLLLDRNRRVRDDLARGPEDLLLQTRTDRFPKLGVDRFDRVGPVDAGDRVRLSEGVEAVPHRA